MATQDSHAEQLTRILDRIDEANRNMQPGTPMAELKATVEAAIASLPALDFSEFDQAIGDTQASARLARRAPEIIGWNADQIVEWVEELAKRVGKKS